MTATVVPLQLRVPRRVAAPQLRNRFRVFCLFFVVAIWAVGLSDFSAAVTLMSVFALGLFAAGLRYPQAGLVGAGLLCTLDALTRSFLLGGGYLRYNSFNYLLLIVIVLSLRRIITWRDAPVRLLEGLVALLLLGLLYSEDRAFGAQHIANAVAFFALLVVMERAARTERPWATLAVVCGVAGAFGGLVFFLQDEIIQASINANAWAYFPLTALVACCLGVSRNETSRSTRSWLLLLAAINAMWVFLSASRGTSLVAMVVLLYSLLQSRRVWSSVAVIAAILALATLSTGVFGERFERSIQKATKFFDPNYSLSGATSGRSDLAQGGIYLFEQNPMTGVGTGSFAPRWLHLAGLGNMGTYGMGREVQAHSGWIKVAAENGVPGLILLAGFVLSFSWCGFRRRGRGALRVGVLATLVLGVGFVSTEFQPKGLWLLAAAVTLFLREPPQTRPRRIDARPRAPRPPRVAEPVETSDVRV